MKKLLELFEERGKMSSQRLIFIAGNIYAMAMGIWVFYHTHDYVASLTISIALSGTFGTQKLIQKSMEPKGEKHA